MTGFCIGQVNIDGRFIMAPMAGVTDRAFRQICRECGAAATISEMISTQALLFQDKKTRELLSLAPAEKLGWVQIFGSNPAYMADGAQKALDISGAQLLDINMGCPAPKIVKGGDGSALMCQPKLAEEIIRAVVQAVDVPVTVKFRKGWDADSQNYLDFAKMAEAAGAAAITLHGRTRAQMYAGKADWDAIGTGQARRVDSGHRQRRCGQRAKGNGYFAGNRRGCRHDRPRRAGKPVAVRSVQCAAGGRGHSAAAAAARAAGNRTQTDCSGGGTKRRTHCHAAGAQAHRVVSQGCARNQKAQGGYFRAELV